MIVPSAGYTLESGLVTYANTVGTYLNVAPTGFTLNQSEYNRLLPPNLIDQVRNLPDVQSLYPISTNSTGIELSNVTLGHTRIPSLTIEHTTALMGSKGGYPSDLIQLIKGRLPRSGTAEYVLFTNSPPDQFYLNSTSIMEIAGIRFNATLVGLAAVNPPISGSISLLLDSSFVANELGPKIFGQTFGQEGFNYLIVKVATLARIEQVANEIETLLKQYPAYEPNYDQASVINLNALISQTAPLYAGLGIVSLGITSALTLFVIWLSVRRRVWEAGVLVVQGWTWKAVSNFYLVYYLALAALSFILSLAISEFLSPLVRFSFQLYGQQIGLQTALQVPYVVLTMVLSIVISIGGAVFVARRLKRTGLDTILREY